MPRVPTLIDQLEAIVDDMVESGVAYIEGVIDAIAPDGRAFGEERQPMWKQVQDYLALRNQPSAWDAWIREKVMFVQQALSEAPDPQTTIAMVGPWDIVERSAIEYSKKMERELVRMALKNEEVPDGDSY